MPDPDPERRGHVGYSPDFSTLDEVYELDREHLGMPTLEGLIKAASFAVPGTLIGPAAISDREMHHFYVDALLDLHKLLEEYRFHITLARLLVLDIEPKVRAVEAEVRPPKDPSIGDEAMPDEIRVMLLPFYRQMPAAGQLFNDPHVLITGGRRFSGWVAGQLIDSAVLRGVACCDRVGTMLWTRAELALPTGRSGKPFLPDFSAARMERLQPSYGDRPEWAPLTALLDHPLYPLARAIRDKFTHGRRLASELHGEATIARVDTPSVQGTDAGTHLALGLGFYDLVVKTAVELAVVLVAERDPPG